MGRELREILREHRFRISSVKNGFSCSCGYFDFTNTSSAWEKWLDHIEEIKRQRSKTRGKGMEHFPVPDDDQEAPPTSAASRDCGDGPERLAAQIHNWLGECFPKPWSVIAGPSTQRGLIDLIASHDAALVAKTREETLKEAINIAASRVSPIDITEALRAALAGSQPQASKNWRPLPKAGR